MPQGHRGWHSTDEVTAQLQGGIVNEGYNPQHRARGIERAGSNDRRPGRVGTGSLDWFGAIHDPYDAGTGWRAPTKLNGQRITYPGRGMGLEPGQEPNESLSACMCFGRDSADGMLLRRLSLRTAS
jgi:hypothetical protein